MKLRFAFASMVAFLAGAAPAAAGSAMAVHFDVAIRLVQGDTDDGFA